ncbi:hypothetical protein MJA45_03005 [Paenibacillus aurantius]|uniref:Uncharacterized protein n=1 Tax=Paenibacillus aurantius TaxID=2918900 RepID=A0AA96LHE6_9BACL|nr:hypothetical protein [Paenibacillus aurantius]WNQ12046.1 hypothetical protein MJA45_03005 [Paenibacillus aurantius]
MAFGVTRDELARWKADVLEGRLAFLTHYWYDERFPGIRTVTKVGCADKGRLAEWCRANELNPIYIHQRPPFPHYDLMGPRQKEILLREGLLDHLERFGMEAENKAGSAVRRPPAR